MKLNLFLEKKIGNVTITFDKTVDLSKVLGDLLKVTETKEEDCHSRETKRRPTEDDNPIFGLREWLEQRNKFYEDHAMK